MPPERKIRLSEQIVDVIREKIRTGGYAPGDRFMSENQLTRELGVSRASVREAIRILEITGHVTVSQGKGIFIADRLERGFAAFSRWLRENRNEIEDHFECRMLIDPKAAGLAAGRIGDDGVGELEAVWEAFSRRCEAGDIPGAIREDARFHLLLARFTRNRTLHALMKTMVESLNDGWITSLHVPERMAHTRHEHREILDRIRKGDPSGAERAMARHLENALSGLRKVMGTEGA